MLSKRFLIVLKALLERQGHTFKDDDEMLEFVYRDYLDVLLTKAQM